MTGDTHSSGESDSVPRGAWDEDFVVEDLFDGVALPEGCERPGRRVSAEDGAPTLFAPAEAGAQDVARDASGYSDDPGEAPVGSPAAPPADLDAARGSFADALDAMIRADDDLAIDAEAELDVISASLGEASGVPEAFLLDDDDVTWGSRAAGDRGDEDAAGGLGEAPAGEPVPEDLFGCVQVEGSAPPCASADEGASAPTFGSWFGGGEDSHPVAGTAPEDGIAPERGADGDEPPPALGESYEPQMSRVAAALEPCNANDAGHVRDAAHGEGMETGGHWAPSALDGDDLEGHDLYLGDGVEEAEGTCGPAAPARRWLGWLVAAAALSIVSFGAAVSMQRGGSAAAGFGDVVAVIEVPRPAVALEIPAPGPLLGESRRNAPNDAGGQAQSSPPSSVEAVSSPSSTDPRTEQSSSPLLADSALPGPQATDHGPTLMAPRIAPAEPNRRARVRAEQGMVRFGESLFVGDGETRSTSAASVADADLAGVRAFVQLRNGNYFVGRVKRIGKSSVTLRMAAGELTIARGNVTTIAPIGAEDHEALQRSTEGAVRMSSGGGDVVVQLRSREVRLPRAVVGAVATGTSGGDVQLKTTPEEDGWLRAVAERSVRSQGVRAPQVSPSKRGSDR